MSGAKSKDYGVVEWLRAHRISLGPLYLALPILGLGITSNVLLTGLQVAMVIAAVLLAGFVWITTRVHGWRRQYIGSVITLAMGWVAWAAGRATFDGWLWAVVSLLLGSVILAIPHWVDRVKRTQVQMENMIRDWPIRGGRIGLGTTQITSLVHTDIGWTARLKWAPGEHMVDAVARKEIEIESALGLEQGELKVSPDGKSNVSVMLNVTLEDPHSEAVLWEIPTHETEDGRLKIDTLHGADKIKIGVRTDGTEKFLQMFVPGWGARQCLIAGMKGSGKSGLLNRLWAHFSLCDDVVQWGADLKGGAELGPWRGAFDWIVTTREQAVAQMEAVWELVERRNSMLSTFKPVWKSWKGSAERPWLVWSVDEVASLLGNASSKELDMFEDICRKARSAGVAVIIATQYPTLAAIGSSQIRQQIDQRFCFRMADDTGEDYVLTSGKRVNAHHLDEERPGTCFHENNTKVDPLSMRVTFVGDGSNGTPDTIGRLVPLLTGMTPVLDRESIANGVEKLEAFANRERFDGSETPGPAENETPAPEAEVPEWSENGDADLSDVVSQSRAGMSPGDRETAERESREEAERESQRLPEDEAKAAVLAALAENAGGLGASELADIATRKRTWTYDHLGELEKAGVVKRTGSGTYALVPQTVHSL